MSFLKRPSHGRLQKTLVTVVRYINPFCLTSKNTFDVALACGGKTFNRVDVDDVMEYLVENGIVAVSVEH